MAMTAAQAAKKIADALNDSRGHTQGRNIVQGAAYSSGDTVTVTFRYADEGEDEKLEWTLTVS